MGRLSQGFWHRTGYDGPLSEAVMVMMMMEN